MYLYLFWTFCIELTAGARDRNKVWKKARKKVCGQSAVEYLCVLSLCLSVLSFPNLSEDTYLGFFRVHLKFAKMEEA